MGRYASGKCGMLPITAPEILTASTTASLTEPTVHGGVVTLTLSRSAFARSIFDIRDAVTVSGIAGVTIPWHQPDRKSDTEITVELEFNGDIGHGRHSYLQRGIRCRTGLLWTRPHGANTGHRFHGIGNRLDCVPINRSNVRWERRDPYAR